MEQLAEFISAHINDDTSRLLLARSKWPGIDMDLAVNCIESRRKLKGKVQEWFDDQSLIFPARLSAEQCSSSATALYKSRLAERIALNSSLFSDSVADCTGKEENISPMSLFSDFRTVCDGPGKEWRIADLTGGLGVDSWFFSKRATRVLYNEMQKSLCQAAEYNFKKLGAANITVTNMAVGNSSEETSPAALLSEFGPDIVYMDPARRGEGGRKVFLIEECTPDVLTLKDEIFGISRHILIKLSPMADISMVCNRLGPACREVHVVSAGGECKELLIWMDREWSEEYSIHAVELPVDYSRSEPAVFSFHPSEEQVAGPAGNDSTPGQSYPALHLFEPGKSMMKAGAFNLISKRFNITKLGKSTHYYVFDDAEKIQDLKGLGKVYEILRMEPMDKRTLKAAGRDFPKSEVTARNIPMDTDALRKKLGVTSGDDAHIFGLKSDCRGNLLLCTKRVL